MQMKLSVMRVCLRLGAVTGVLLVAACAWVKPSTDSQQVALVKPELVASCQRLGETSAKTLAKIVVINRSDRKLAHELVTLAKNQAAVMQGDAIVAETPIVAGEQTFGVYRCR